MKKLLSVRRDFKFVIMSATINLDLFRNYFPSGEFSFGEVGAGERTNYEVEEYWLERPLAKDAWKKEAVGLTIKILQTTDTGDILVFIRAPSDAKGMCAEIEAHTAGISKSYCTILSSGSKNQDLAIDADLYKTSSGGPYTRKVILSTNVAESSLTVNGIVYVIDPGLEYDSAYEPGYMCDSLQSEYVSRASAKQRKGRAGRVRPGVCYHLYTREMFEEWPEYPVPDIQKTDLSQELLGFFGLEYVATVGDLMAVLDEFIEPPEPRFRIDALQRLHGIGALTSMGMEGTITPLGAAMNQLTKLTPSDAKTLIAGYYYDCLDDMANIFALKALVGNEMKGLFRSSVRVGGDPCLANGRRRRTSAQSGACTTRGATT